VSAAEFLQAKTSLHDPIAPSLPPSLPPSLLTAASAARPHPDTGRKRANSPRLPLAPGDAAGEIGGRRRTSPREGGREGGRV